MCKMNSGLPHMKRIKTYYFWQRTKAVHGQLGKLLLLCAFVLFVIGNLEIVKIDSHAVGCYTGIVQFKFVNLGIVWLNLMFGKDLTLSYYAMEHLKARKSHRLLKKHTHLRNIDFEEQLRMMELWIIVFSFCRNITFRCIWNVFVGIWWVLRTIIKNIKADLMLSLNYTSILCSTIVCAYLILLGSCLGIQEFPSGKDWESNLQTNTKKQYQILEKVSLAIDSNKHNEEFG
eukprot:278624_1